MLMLVEQQQNQPKAKNPQTKIGGEFLLFLLLALIDWYFLIWKAEEKVSWDDSQRCSFIFGEQKSNDNDNNANDDRL